MSEEEKEVRSMTRLSDVALEMVMTAALCGGNQSKFNAAKMAMELKKQQKEDGLCMV